MCCYSSACSHNICASGSKLPVEASGSHAGTNPMEKAWGLSGRYPQLLTLRNKLPVIHTTIQRTMTVAISALEGFTEHALLSKTLHCISSHISLWLWKGSSCHEQSESKSILHWEGQKEKSTKKSHYIFLKQTNTMLWSPCVLKSRVMLFLSPKLDSDTCWSAAVT